MIWKGLLAIHLENKAIQAKIYVVDTIHVSQKIAQLVKDVIRAIIPNYITMELRKMVYITNYKT